MEESKKTQKGQNALSLLDVLKSMAQATFEIIEDRSHLINSKNAKKIESNLISEDKFNEKVSKMIENRVDHWAEKLTEEASKLKSDDRKELEKLEVSILTMGIRLDSIITKFLSVLSKFYAIKKKMNHQRFLYYYHNYSSTINGAERKLSIESDIAYYTRTIELIETYIENMRSCKDKCTSLHYAMKNKIQMLQIIGQN